MGGGAECVILGVGCVIGDVVCVISGIGCVILDVLYAKLNLGRESTKIGGEILEFVVEGAMV